MLTLLKQAFCRHMFKRTFNIICGIGIARCLKCQKLKPLLREKAFRT